MATYTQRRGLLVPSLADEIDIEAIGNNFPILDQYCAFIDLAQTWTGIQTFASGNFAVPVAVTSDTAASVGNSNLLAMSNHQHGVTTYASAPAAWTQGGSAGTSGTAPSRGNHSHPVTVSSSTPTAAAVAGSAGTTDGSVMPPSADHVHPLGYAAALAAISSAQTPGAASETVITNFQIPANVLSVGTTIGFKASGTLSASSAGTLLARIRAGTNGTTADAAVAATAATGAVTSAVGFYLDGHVSVRTTGSGGTLVGNVMLVVGSTTGLSAQTATTAINTTASSFLDLTLTSGGTTPVLTVVSAAIHVMRG